MRLGSAVNTVGGITGVPQCRSWSAGNGWEEQETRGEEESGSSSERILPSDTGRTFVRREFEDEWLELLSDTGKEEYLVCSVYIPPRDLAALRRFRDGLVAISECNDKVVVMGDFNARCLSLGDRRNNALAQHFEDLVDQSKLHVCNAYGVPTRKAKRAEGDSILDVCLVSHALEPRVTDWGVQEEFSSDHLKVSFSLQFPGVRPRARRRKRVMDFREADWPQFRVEAARKLRVWKGQSHRHMELAHCVAVLPVPC